MFVWTILGVCFSAAQAWRSGDGQMQCGGVLNNKPVETKQEFISNARAKIRIKPVESNALKRFDEILKYEKAMKQTIDYFQAFLGLSPLIKLALKNEKLCDLVNFDEILPRLSDTFGQSFSNADLTLEETDLLLYVDLGCENHCSEGCKNTSHWPVTIAFSGICQVDDKFQRPTVGLIYFCQQGMEKVEHTQLVAALKHEIVHILGLNKRNLESMGISTAKRLDWQVSKATYTERTQNFTGEQLTKTRDAARNHFGCETLLGAEIEDSGFIPESRGNHWEKRVFWNEMMTATIGKDNAYLSEITASFLEEIRYRPNDPYFYSVDRALIGPDLKDYWFGKQLGCVFAMSSCYAYLEHAAARYSDDDGKIGTAAFPYCTFMNSVLSISLLGAEVCFKEGNRKKLYCDIHKTTDKELKDPFGNVLPIEEFRTKYAYFHDVIKNDEYDYIGRDPWMDYCPVFTFPHELPTLPVNCSLVSCRIKNGKKPIDCPDLSAKEESNKDPPVHTTYTFPNHHTTSGSSSTVSTSSSTKTKTDTTAAKSTQREASTTSTDGNDTKGCVKTDSCISLIVTILWVMVVCGI